MASPELAISPAAPSPDGGDRSIDELTGQLLDVLDDESASMVPPTARGMSVDEWRRLGPRLRARLSQQHLAAVDPRLLPRAVMRWTDRRSRQTNR